MKSLEDELYRDLPHGEINYDALWATAASLPLDTSYAEALWLRFGEGKTYAVIGEEVGRSKSLIQQKVRHALRYLRHPRFRHHYEVGLSYDGRFGDFPYWK